MGGGTGSAGGAGAGGAGGAPAGVSLLVEDFEVVETERRTTAAVALCVDMSFSMVQEGRWGPMKQTALALSHLVQTRFRHDALQIIGFNLAARRLSPVQLAEAEPEWVQGTNLQHALMLASRHLRRHPDAEPVVLVVTDGEPTAHLEADGMPEFQWPTTQRDAARDRCAGRRAAAQRRRRSTSSCWATTRGWPGSSTRWPGAPVAASSPRRSTGWASTSWPTTSAPAAAGADAAAGTGTSPRQGDRLAQVSGCAGAHVCDATDPMTQARRLSLSQRRASVI